jgi:uncharacterized membrane protein YphA (DoxX/SURF4 family)
LKNKVKALLDNSWVELAARWILGTIFIYASFHKIISPADFAKIIYGYGLFPGFSINLIAIILPFVELISGLALILGIYPRAAVLFINILLVAFITVLSINLIRGHEFECGCFSPSNMDYTTSAKTWLIRDVIFLILGLQVYLFGGTRRGCFVQFVANYVFNPKKTKEI